MGQFGNHGARVCVRVRAIEIHGTNRQRGPLGRERGQQSRESRLLHSERRALPRHWRRVAGRHQQLSGQTLHPRQTGNQMNQGHNPRGRSFGPGRTS